MRQLFVVALLSVLAFAAGYGVRIWVDGTRPIPAPPQVGGEFTDSPHPAQPAPAPAAPTSGANRAEIAAQIERLRPQIAAFRSGLHDIDVEFDRNLQSLLTPEQHELYRQRRKRLDAMAIHPHASGVLTEDEIVMLRDRPLWGAVDHISVQWKLDDYAKDLKLDSTQLEKMRGFLQHRRERFLALVDTIPLPSLQLMSLAPFAQRLGAPAAPAK